jgi:hypothetical protein
MDCGINTKHNVPAGVMSYSSGQDLEQAAKTNKRLGSMPRLLGLGKS